MFPSKETAVRAKYFDQAATCLVLILGTELLVLVTRSFVGDTPLAREWAVFLRVLLFVAYWAVSAVLVTFLAVTAIRKINRGLKVSRAIRRAALEID
jgi:hypothetical protein